MVGGSFPARDERWEFEVGKRCVVVRILFGVPFPFSWGGQGMDPIDSWPRLVTDSRASSFAVLVLSDTSAARAGEQFLRLQGRRTSTRS